MAYKVFIETGKGINYNSSGSTPLKTKTAVYKWIKRNPLGNSRTKVKVYNTRTGKTITDDKRSMILKFSPFKKYIK